MQKETPGTDKIRPRTKSPSHKMRARQKETDQHVSHYLFIYLPYYKHSLSSSTEKMQETGSMAFCPYPRRLECLTTCRYHSKGSTFSSVILRP